jgi:hypothetical protein
LRHNDKDNRATSWVALVTINETRQGQIAPVHPFVIRCLEFIAYRGPSIPPFAAEIIASLSASMNLGHGPRATG